MPISDQGQLDLSTFEQLQAFQDSLPIASVITGPYPAIAADPSDATRSVTKMEVVETTDTDPCGIRYSFLSDQEEVGIEFDVLYTHPAATTAGSLTLLELLDRPLGVVAALTRLTDSSTEWRAVTATTPSSFTFTTGIAKDAWERIRLRYKKATTGSNGILQAWRYNFGTSS